LESLPPPDAVLLEGPDDERVRRHAELTSRSPAQLRADRREVLEVDADRDAEHTIRIHARRDDEVVHLAVGDLDAQEAIRARTQGLEGTVELRVAGRARPPVQVRGGEPVRRVEPGLLQRGEVTR